MQESSADGFSSMAVRAVNGLHQTCIQGRECTSQSYQSYEDSRRLYASDEAMMISQPTP